MNEQEVTRCSKDAMNLRNAPGKNSISLVLKRQRVKAALANLYIGDALSTPVHWYYNPGDILRAFPPHGIARMEAAPESHPSSIMALHSTTRGGRGKQDTSQQKKIVGDVILRGRGHLWGQPNGHYHHGMAAGENTLNAWWARLAMNYMTDNKSYEATDWVSHYIDFMTADPPRHPDTYAESCHRGFFANLQAGKDPLLCGAVTHDTPSMGALVSVAPIALALLATESLETAQRACREHVWLTHPDRKLLSVVDAYVKLLFELTNGEDENLETETSRTAAFVRAAAVIPGTRLELLIGQQRGDSAVVGKLYSLACYITDSWPSVCYLAARYSENPRSALLINTNLGGENAHRGAVLGTLVGLASAHFDQDLFNELAESASLSAEIDAWLDCFLPLR